MERRWIYIVITLLTVVMTLSSCTDEQDDARRKVSVALMPLGRANVEIETRTDPLPDGYRPYVEICPAEQMPQSSIGIYLVQEPIGTNPIVVNRTHTDLNSFTYRTVNNRGAWYSDATIEEDATYRVYGFHPATGIAGDSHLEYTHTTTPDNSEVAVLTLPTFGTVCSSDVCVVVGVKKATVENNTPVDLEHSEIKLGRFIYTAGKDDNYVYLLMDHIFSCVNFSFTIDPDYNTLRDIRLRKVEIESPSSAEVSVEVTLKSNSAGTDPIQDIHYSLPTPSGSSTTTPVAIIYEKEVSEAAILPSSSSACLHPFILLSSPCVTLSY